VGEVGSWGELGWSWRFGWRRTRFEWENFVEEEMMNLITRKTLNKDFEDIIEWSGDPKGVFSVKSAYLTMCNYSNGSSHNVFSLLWKTKAVPKDVCTAWRVLIGRLPTYDNLIRRGLVVNSSVCVFCKSAEESAQHIFMTCLVAQRIWVLCKGGWLLCLFSTRIS